MALKRWFVLVFAATFALGMLIPDAATAGDQDLSRAGKKALRFANRVVRTARATDEETVNALKALELFPHIDVTEFLVEKALKILAVDEKRRDSYQAVLTALAAMTDAGSQVYLQ